MGSITPVSHPAQGRATGGVAGRKTRSITAARDRVIRQKREQGREQWSAQGIMRAAKCSHSYGLARHVLITLLLMADGSKFVGATIREIGDIAGLSREAARWHLEQLRKLGDISVCLKGGGRGRHNYYHLDVLDHLPEEPEGGDAA